MAKDTDQKAGALKAEKTGGTLSGLLAEEKAFDRRALWRIGWWGTAAVGTVTLAVIASQAAREWRHDRISGADLARQTQLVQSLAHQAQSESRQLASAIENLNTDRDRLQARITVLEEGLESVTGALAKQNSPQTSTSSPPSRAALPSATQTAAADPQASSGASPAPASSPQASSPPASSASAAPSATGSIGTAAGQSNSTATETASAAPALASVTTTPAATVEKPRPDPAKPPTGSTQAVTPQGGTQAARASGAAAAPATSHASPARSALAALVTPKSIIAPVTPVAGKPVEPEKPARAAAIPAPDAGSSKPADASDEAPLTPAQKTEFAVDLGTANSVNGLRALWRGLVKSNNDLATLRPIIMVKEANTGYGMQLRLGAGPLGDAAAAAKICAGLAESQRSCETTVYDGQRLAIRGDEPGAQEAGKFAPIVAPKPARRRPYQSQRHTVREEPPAPAPAPPPAETKPAEPSTLSTLFRRS